jgi:hypothetical protein
LRAFRDGAFEDAAVNRKNLVLTRFRPPQRDQLAQFLRMLVGQVVTFGRVFRDVVEFPSVRLEIIEDLVGDQPAKFAAFRCAFSVARSGIAAVGSPAVAIDRALPNIS